MTLRRKIRGASREVFDRLRSVPGYAAFARCLCALCGGEQYHWDRVWQWRGRWICRLCWARLEKEEEIT